jgi:hypothetical protein
MCHSGGFSIKVRIAAPSLWQMIMPSATGGFAARTSIGLIFVVVIRQPLL